MYVVALQAMCLQKKSCGLLSYRPLAVWALGDLDFSGLISTSTSS